MSDTPRTDAASVSRAFIAREIDDYSHQFVLAGNMRELERELAAAKAEVEALRVAGQTFVQDYENGDMGDLKHYARAMRAALKEAK